MNTLDSVGYGEMFPQFILTLLSITLGFIVGYPSGSYKSRVSVPIGIVVGLGCAAFVWWLAI